MRQRLITTLAGAALLLGACGGGSGPDPVAPPLTCSVADRQHWLRDYMRAWYLWSAVSPSPDPAPFATLEAYFDALLYGGDAEVPPDTFSHSQSSASYAQFYGEGKTLGYGLFVAGVEVEGQPDLPLRVRYVEPLSDAAVQGLRRGEQILSVNGRPAAELIEGNDYAALVPAAAGEQLALVVRGAEGDRAVTLTAAVYTLTPVSAHGVLTTPAGRRLGYVLVKDMIDLARDPLEAAFARFQAEGVTEVVLDLRYNGGGRVAVGRTVASYVGGTRTAGRDYARLLYNDDRAADYDQTFRFDNPAAALGLARVYVLSGPRTCSASEQVVNGLAPFVEVVLIGGGTCGKPVGFLPRDDRCGTTWSVVNFESVNALGQGRYYAGFAPTCAAADDLDHPLGAPEEGLLATAMAHVDTGACPADGRRVLPLAAPRDPGRRRWVEPGEVRGMVSH